MKSIPLSELEMFELLSVAYPEKFKADDDETWEAAQQFAEDLSGYEDIAGLLGRVVMLTAPMQAGVTKRLSHCLGKVESSDGAVSMVSAVRRDAEEMKGDIKIY